MKTAMNYNKGYGCQLVTFMGTLFMLCADAGALFAQQVDTTRIYSEAPIVFESGVKKSQYLNVKFKQNVLSLPSGVVRASTANLAGSFTNLVLYFSQLEQRYGNVIFHKKIPNAIWGDVWRTNKRTGKPVQVPDMSQLFIVQFPQMVPIDSIVAELEKLEEVEYAYQPIQAIPLAEPNDPCYNNITPCYSSTVASDQWNLKRINAPKAWDITKGSSSILAAIIDPENFNRNHADLTTKFNGGDVIAGSGEHGTEVAGVLGAATDTPAPTGIASLGWNILLRPYVFTDGIWEGVDVQNSLVHDIQQARDAQNPDVDIINFSIVTFGYVSGTNCRESKSYPEVSQQIAGADSQGIMVVAGTGNKDLNEGRPGCSQYFPYTPYPASYTNVIGVAATDINDEHPQDYNYESADSPLFIDVSAPGYEVVTTSGSAYAEVKGTSYAAPHGAALVRLILSINSGLTSSNIGNVLTSTAEKVGQFAYTNGRNAYLGSGRINAYQALLLTHAYSSKSVSSEAIGANNARHLANQGSSTFHKVFESGITSGGSVLGEIFYRNSTNGGSTWNTPIRLSSGNEKNRYPCIAERGGNVFVVWQRHDGSSHDIHFRKFTGGAWANAIELAGNVGTNVPLPVITSPDNNKLMVVYRAGNNLAWKHSTTNYGDTWPYSGSINAGSGEALNSPSVAATKTPWGAATTGLVYATKEIPNASHIMTRYYNPDNNTWSSATNISSSLPGYLSQHAHPSVSHSGDPAQNYVHVAWDAYDSQYVSRVIIHRLGNPGIWNFGTQYYEFHYQSEDRPSISGLASDDAMMVFQNGTTKYSYGRYDGTYWNIQFPPLTGTHPSVATGSTSTKYLWTSGTSSPYTVNITSSTFSKPALSPEFQADSTFMNVKYQRSIAMVDTSIGAWFDVRVEGMTLKTNSHATENIAFANVASSLEMTHVHAFDGLSSQTILLPAEAESLTVHYAISGEKLSAVKNGGSPLRVELIIFEKSGSTTYVPVFLIDMESLEKKDLTIALAVSAFAGKEIILKTQVTGISSRAGLVASLGHIYRIMNTIAPEVQSQQATTSQSEAFAMRVFPNPFNPSTKIHIELPELGVATLRIYNIQGQLVRELLNGYRNAGQHTLVWNGRDDYGKVAASGTYFLHLETATKKLTSKMLLMR